MRGLLLELARCQLLLRALTRFGSIFYALFEVPSMGRRLTSSCKMLWAVVTSTTLSTGLERPSF